MHVRNLEKEIAGIFDAVLHDLRSYSHVEIACQHERHVVRSRFGFIA
jgi:hypothetical protein